MFNKEGLQKSCFFGMKKQKTVIYLVFALIKQNTILKIKTNSYISGRFLLKNFFFFWQNLKSFGFLKRRFGFFNLEY